MMESFLDYYNRLYSTIPESYSKFGNFGEGVWDKMITEGLITSYPKEKVIEFLTSIGVKNVSHSNFETIDILIQRKHFKSFKSELNDKLKVYGYYISNHTVPYNAPPNTYKLIVEPIKPSELNPDPKNGKFYHITYNGYMDKIKKVGLTPKDSRTVFSHPGNRIYIIQTNDLPLLDQLKHMLSNSRQQSLAGSNYPNHLIDDIKPENMVILNVDVSGLKLFNDPMFPSYMKTFFACFTTNNIHPNKITITNY